MDRIKIIYDEEFEDFFNNDEKNGEIKGLQILVKYSDDVEVNVGHDELFMGLKEEEYEKLSDDEIREIFKNNWRWEGEYNCFAKFV